MSLMQTRTKRRLRRASVQIQRAVEAFKKDHSNPVVDGFDLSWSTPKTSFTVELPEEKIKPGWICDFTVLDKEKDRGITFTVIYYEASDQFYLEGRIETAIADLKHLTKTEEQNELE